MKLKKFFIASALIFAFGVGSMAQTTFYVAKTGSNKAPGTDSAKPLKNITKAIEKAADGDIIKVAEGNYFGNLNSGNINVNKAVTIMGGFSADFSARDILKYRTLVQPDAASNGTQNGQGTMQIQVNNGGKVVIDGILFDRGNSIAYNPKGEGQPEGVASAMMQAIGQKGVGGADLTEQGVLTTQTAEIYLQNPSCDLVIRNCSFVNAPNYGIRGSIKGEVTIDNCIFVNVRMAAVEIPGSSMQVYSKVNFTNNTVLFCWSRLKDLGDMGYGYRYMTGTHSYLDHNIFGLCVFAALDRCRIDPNAQKEKQRITTANYNMFFLNREADLTLPGGGMFQRINVDQFEDVDQLAESDGNVSIKDPSVFKGKIDEAYLNGFLSVSYDESTSYDPNSPANQFRSAMGMNQTGTMTSKVSMFANRYPFETALKLFGAVNGFGAQMPK